VKYMIIPAKDVQAGDVIFTNNGNEPGIQVCGRVVGINVPNPHPDITEFRVLVIDRVDGSEGSTVLGFRHGTRLGVARQDEFVDVDIAAILAENPRASR